MPIIEQLVAYPPIRDHIWWLADSKPRSEMSPEELAALRARVRVNYARMRERMAMDPEYREARLEVARRGTKRWQDKNRDNAVVIAKRREKDRERRERLRGELNARSRELYTGNRAARIRQQNREWYARNRENRKEYRKAYYLANRERLLARERERRRANYAADPQKFLAKSKAWREKNPELAHLYVRISAHKRRGAPGEYTRQQWLALVRVYGYRCGYCGRVRPLEVDHRIPIIRGGSNTIDNIIPACRSCNRRKHDKTEAEFREWLAAQAPKDSSTGTEMPLALAVWVPAG